jgi:hypothetical protein
MTKVRILLLCAVFLAIAALSGHEPQVRAQGFVDRHPVYQVPTGYGEYRNFLAVNGEYWPVFEGKDGTVRVVKMEGVNGKPVVMMEIQRK